jgi:predicted acylesterase/phospholipase RssA
MSLTKVPVINYPDALIIAGGGAKSMSGLGAIHVLKRNGQLRQMKVVAGTSAGSIVAAGVALNRDPVSMCKAFIDEIYTPSFDISNFVNTFGLDTGVHLSRWIDIVLGNKSYTFQSILEETGIFLVICATNLTECCPEYFSPAETPDMDVRTAIRMSCSIPVYFSAIKYNDRVFVDGALTDAFPYDYVKNLPNVKNPLGIRYSSKEHESPILIDSIDKFFQSLIVTATKDKYSKDSNVLDINVKNITVLDFKKPRALKKAFGYGVVQTRNLLKKLV